MDETEDCTNYIGAVEKAYNPESQSFTTYPINSLINFKYDKFTVNYDDLTKDIYTYYLEGQIVGRIDISYTDSTKELISIGELVDV